MPFSVPPSPQFFNKLIIGAKSSCNHHNVHPADRGKNLVDLERGGASVERERQHQLHYGKGLGGYHHRSPFSVSSFLSFLPSLELTCSRTGLPPAQRCRAWTITLVPFTSKRWAAGNSRSATCLVPSVCGGKPKMKTWQHLEKTDNVENCLSIVSIICVQYRE